MSLRIAFDLDGTLADFEKAYREVEQRLYGEQHPEVPVPTPEAQAEAEEGGGDASDDRSVPDADPSDAEKQRTSREQDKEAQRRAVLAARVRERVWNEIEATPDFWTGLDPIEPGAVARIQELAIRYRWEIFFITQRPRTAGETVQRQSQRWLVKHGYEWPSVIVLSHSRGRAAHSLQLDYLVDDSAKNCVDIISESSARALLVLRREDMGEIRPQRARSLGIGVSPSISDCLDLFEGIERARSNPSLMARVARMVGWKP